MLPITNPFLQTPSRSCGHHDRPNTSTVIKVSTVICAWYILYNLKLQNHSGSFDGATYYYQNLTQSKKGEMIKQMKLLKLFIEMILSRDQNYDLPTRLLGKFAAY